VKLVAISADEHEESRIFAKEGKIHFPLLRDGDLKVADAYGVAMKGGDIAIPATFIITKSGRIHYKKVGETQVDRADLDHVLELLDGLAKSG
jgi:peroxiredoxin